MKPEGDDAGAAPSAPSAPPAHATPAPAPASPSTGAAERAVQAPACRAIASEALFGGAGEVQISHRGSLYRLRQTALGKLILTK